MRVSRKIGNSGNENEQENGSIPEMRMSRKLEEFRK